MKDKLLEIPCSYQGAKQTYLLSKGRSKGNISGDVKKKPTEEWLNRF